MHPPVIKHSWLRNPWAKSAFKWEHFELNQGFSTAMFDDQRVSWSAESENISIISYNLHTYIYTYIHIYTYIYIHTYTHRWTSWKFCDSKIFIRDGHSQIQEIHPSVRNYLPTSIHTSIHPPILTYVLTYMHTYIHPSIHTYVLTYMHTVKIFNTCARL